MTIEQLYVELKKQQKRKIVACNSKIFMCNNRSEGDQDPKASRSSHVKPPQPCKEESENTLREAKNGDNE